MHYQNGREAKVGDRIVVKDYRGPYIGIVVGTNASTSCNLDVIPAPATTYNATAGECLHVEDTVPEALR